MEAWEEGSGVMVTELRAGGLAAASGLICVGDVAVSINGVPCKTAPEAAKSLREAEGEVELRLLSSVPRMQSLTPPQQVATTPAPSRSRSRSRNRSRSRSRSPSRSPSPSPHHQVAALASVRLKDGQKEYLCKWMPCSRLSWVPLPEIIALDDDCMQMWEEFEAGCHKVDVTIRKKPGGSFGIELSGNCVVGMRAGGAAEEGGELQVRDVVVGLDGDVLHDTTLATALARHPEDTIKLSVVRPGEPVVNQGWLAAQRAHANSKEGKKEAKRAEKEAKQRAKEEEKAEKERRKQAEKEAKRAAEEAKKAAKKDKKGGLFGSKKGGAKGEAAEAEASLKAEASEEASAAAEKSVVDELSDRLKDGAKIAKPEASEKSEKPPPLKPPGPPAGSPPTSLQAQEEAATLGLGLSLNPNPRPRPRPRPRPSPCPRPKQAESSEELSVSASVGQEMVGRAAGPGGRRRPKERTPRRSVGAEGSAAAPESPKSPPKSPAEDEAPKKPTKKRADDDFKVSGS